MESSILLGIRVVTLYFDWNFSPDDDFNLIKTLNTLMKSLVQWYLIYVYTVKKK